MATAHKINVWFFTDSEPRLAYRYTKLDDERPTILFIHGGPGSCCSYVLPFCGKALERRYNVVWFDQRGCGNSDRNLSPYQYNPVDNVVDIVRLLDELKLSQVVVMGHSWGGMVAGMFAAQHPQRVSALINLCGPGSFLDLQHNLLNNLLQHYQSEPGIIKKIRATQYMPYGFARLVRILNYAHSAGMYYKNCAKPKQDFNTLNQLAVQCGYYDNETVKESEEVLLYGCDYHSLSTFDIYAQLKQVQCPALVIGGKHDGVVDIACLERYRSSIPNAQMILFEHSGHYPFQDETEQFIKVTESFINQVSH